MESVLGLFAKVNIQDLAIISAFLLLNLLIGVYFSRGIGSLREYALGSRNFSTGTLTATIVATWMAGSTVPFVAYETHQNGLYFIIPCIADGLSFFIVAYFLAPRMSEFLGNLSIAEAMGDMFGQKIRAITALSGMLPAIGTIAMQFTILSALLTNFIGMSGFYAVLLSSAVVIIYSTFGGIKAVTFTDVIQFFTFGVIIPITAFCIWLAIDNNAVVLLKVIDTHPAFDFSQVMDFKDARFINAAFLFLFFLIPSLDPTHFQRVSMGRNVKQVMKSFAIASVIIVLCQYLVFHFIGILLLADPTVSENVASLDTNNLVNYIIDHYLEVGFKGLFVVGIMAMSMSTADSYINSGAILFSHDFCKSVGIRVPEKWELMFVRVTACCVGILALVSSLYFKSIWELTYAAYNFYMPIVSAPMLLAIFGFRGSRLSVLFGMITGFITVCGFKLYTDIDNIVVPGMLANLIVYMSSHYLLRQPGGWVGIKGKVAFTEIQNERKESVNDLCSAIKNFSVIKYLANSASKQEATYVYLGFFCVISIFSSLYSLPKTITDQHHLLIDVISYTTLILATVMITYPSWMEKFKNQLFISSVSHISIFAILVVCSSLLVLLSNFNQLQIVILTASLITAAILLRWYITLSFIILGMLISAQFYSHYARTSLVFENVTMEFSVIYVILMASAISIVFLKPKEDALDISEARSDDLWKKITEMEREVQKANNLKTEFLNNISHEVRTPMTGITSLGQALWDNYDALPEAKRKECVHSIAKSSDRLISLMNNILDLSSLTSLNIQLNMCRVNLSSLVNESIKKCKKLYLEEKHLQFDIHIEDDIYTKCDPYYIGHTIDNLIVNAITYSNPSTTINITLSQKEASVEFSIRDEGIGIPQNELFDIFRPFTVSSQTRTPAGGRGVGLALCEGAITAHKGRIWAESDGKNWCVFKFTI